MTDNMKKFSPSKKEVERWQFNQFISLFPGFPAGQIETSEEPDFIVDTGDLKIGVELTDLYWENPVDSSPQQAQESLRFRIAETAQRLYEKEGLPNLYASIHFNSQYVLRKSEVQRLSKMIADVLVKNVPSIGQSYGEEYDWDNRDYFPEEIMHISAYNFPSAEQSFFHSPSAAFVPTLEEKDIRRVLLLKADKLARYRERCNEVWLLINCDVGQLSSFFKHEEAVLQLSYQSHFDRVFLCRHMEHKIHELFLYSGPRAEA